ncbi:flavin reductase family protein [Nocardiopsis sediminis]|uniref:Flavin reductase family protein n=1 Tax=Nocardiopsis sediminis TaxID=1778267 RepID=A0ABV8FVF7_9ACTN
MNATDRGPRGGGGKPARVDPAHFRDVLGRFCSGITAVTADVDGRPVGLTCQSFMSMSLEPPLVAFAPAITSTSYPSIRETGRFAASVLAESQVQVALSFARSGGDKFADVPWHRGVTGAPLLDGAVAHIECELADEYRVGDHLLVVGKVVALSGHPDAAPLLYFQGSFAALSASHRPKPERTGEGKPTADAGF